MWPGGESPPVSGHETQRPRAVSAEEHAAAVPSLAGPALIRVAEVLFDATDKDGNQTIDADEYRAMFRTVFQRDTAGTGTGYTRSAFIKDFPSFMTGRLRTTPYDTLLAQA